MIPIEQLFKKESTLNYIKEHAPGFVEQNAIEKLTITPIKKHIVRASNFYHVVIRYDDPQLTRPIFCTAHSNENRKTAFNALGFINKHGFKKSKTVLPKSIFYDKKLNAFFYQGIEGENLLHYIKKPDSELEKYIRGAARWIAQLHEIPTDKAKNFNPENSRIKTVVPGPDYFLDKIKREFPLFFESIKKYFNRLVKKEEENISKLHSLALIHGDFHPENVIINKDTKEISVIDFTDICLADYARDIGAFIQQLRFMARGKRSTDEIKSLQKKFLQAYLSERKIKLTDNLEKRITLYRAWTALRSSIYFLTKEPSEEPQARVELGQLEEHIKRI